MTDKKIIEYFLNDDYSFTIELDSNGKKIGRLVDLKSEKVLADDLQQKALPENIPNLLNAIKVIISAAWQDGKILPAEREAFDKAFEGVNLTKKQRKEIEKEFEKPTPIKKLIKHITSREQKLLVLETSLLLVMADNEFHPKEKEFIEFLSKKFKLDKADFALLYRVLPEKVKKYIIQEKLHEGLQIQLEEIETLNKFTEENKVEDIMHEDVYVNFVNNWNNRRSRYSRIKSY